MHSPIVYDFEQLDSQLARPPLAALRALRLSGLHLRHDAWAELELETRWGLVRLGSQPQVDAARVRTLLGRAPPRAVQMVPPWSEPSAESIPDALLQALGPRNILTPHVWRSLRPLDRQLLGTLSKNRHLLQRAMLEIFRLHGLPPPFGAEQAPWTGEVARADVLLDAPTAMKLHDRKFHDGRSLVMARVAGVRAARMVAMLLDVHELIGPVQVEATPAFETSHARVTWQAHVSEVGGDFHRGASLLAVTTAASSLYDMLYDHADRSLLALSPAGMREEPWFAAAGNEDQEATTFFRL